MSGLGFLASKKEFTTTFDTTFSTSSTFTTTFSTSKSTTTTFSTSRSTTTTFGTSRNTSRNTTGSTQYTGDAGLSPNNHPAWSEWLHYAGNSSGQSIKFGYPAYYPSGNSGGYIGTTSLQNTYAAPDGYTYYRENLRSSGSVSGINYDYYNVYRRGVSSTSFTTNYNTSRSTTTNFNTSRSTTTNFNTSRSTTTNFNTSRSTNRTTSFYA